MFMNNIRKKRALELLETEVNRLVASEDMKYMLMRMYNDIVERGSFKVEFNPEEIVKRDSEDCDILYGVEGDKYYIFMLSLYKNDIDDLTEPGLNCRHPVTNKRIGFLEAVSENNDMILVRYM